jgi:hypothetical protein
MRFIDRFKGGASMSDQNDPRSFLRATEGRLTLLVAAIIVLLFFAFTYFR